MAALRGDGSEVHAVCRPGSAEETALVAADVPVTILPVRHRLDLAAARALRRLIGAWAPDVVYAPENRTLSAALFATRGLRRPVVIGYRGTMGHLSRWDPAAWLTYLHPRLRRIFCVSNAVRGYLEGLRLPAERLVTIYKGHDPAWYAAPARSLAEFGVAPGDFVVAFAGNMRPVKGVDVLLQGVKTWPRDTRARLLLIGEVRDAAVRRLADDPAVAPYVRLTGYREDAAALIGAADAFVMPSVEREGLPRGVLEAMCQSKPVVVTAVGGMVEQVEHGVSGLVVPPRDPAALGRALLELAADPARAAGLGAASRRRVEERFHIRGTIEAFAREFRRAAAE